MTLKTLQTLDSDQSYKRLVQAMFAGLLLLVGLYIYGVMAIVIDAAAREKTLAATEELASQVSTLESQYVTLSGKVTLDLALAQGFMSTGNQSGFALASAWPLVFGNN